MIKLRSEKKASPYPALTGMGIVVLAILGFLAALYAITFVVRSIFGLLSLAA